jgi:hypothetical protein
MDVGGQLHAPTALPPGKTRYRLYRRLGGPQSRYGQVRKISPSRGFDPRTVQSVASRYTDCAIPGNCGTLLTQDWSKVQEYIISFILIKIFFRFATFLFTL